MHSKIRITLPFLMLALASAPALALPILDGTGFGAPTAHITYDANAPTANYQSPGTTTNAVPYDISLKSDYNYAYFLFQ